MDNQKSLFDLSVDMQGKAHLKEAAKWAKFLAVAGLIVFSLGILTTIISFLFTIPQDNSYNAAYTTGYVIGIATTCILIAAVYIYPCISLLRFSRKTKTAIDTNDVATLNESFRSLKVTLRYFGILSLIGIVFFLIGILANLGF